MIILLLVLLLPAVLLAGIGFILLEKKNIKTAKILFILAGVYLLISYGSCGYLFFNFSLEH